MNKLPQSALPFIFHFVRKQWIKFSIFVLTSIGWAINDAIFPYFLKRIVNALQFYQGDLAGIFIVVKTPLLLLVLFWLIIEIFHRGSGITQIYTFPIFRTNIRSAVFSYVKQHSHEYFASHFAGNLAKKLSDLPTSCQSMVEIMCFHFLTASVGTMVVLTMMWLTQPVFALILLIWLVLHMGLTLFSLRFTNVLWAAQADAVSTLSGKIVDVFTNILNVRLFSRARYEEHYLKKYQRDEIEKSKKAMWVNEIIRIGLGLSGLFLVFGMIITLLYAWSRRWITLGDFTQVGMQSFWLLGWIWFISFEITVFMREMGTVNSALSLVQKGHDVLDVSSAKAIHITNGKIHFEEVAFGYRKGQSVFEHLAVSILAGQKVGLVGFSGSGKSTFVNLLLRFYDVSSGKIFIDDQDISQITQDSLRAGIAMIPQDPTLFHRTLMENIRYGRLEATDAEVIAASKAAHCHEFIEKLEHGYASLVGERGIKLSGGQRQRIAIARAILKNAPILILDEATSSLDSVTEKLVQDSLHELMRGRTTIVVAHRLSTLADMDRILVFDKGRIIEDGTKDTLLASKGHFAMLWNKQTDGFLPD